MKIILLAAGAAALALSAGTALAAPKGSAVAGPKQPIPYSQLGAYMKASPKARASKDWSSAQPMSAAPMPAARADAPASDRAAANTSAIVPVSPNLPGDTAVNPMPSPPTAGSRAAGPALPATPPIDNPPSTAVNPPAATPPGAPPAATPPK